MRTGSHHDRQNRRQVEARNSSRTPSRVRLRKPGVELLEKRTLLATINWSSPSSGDWENPANWDLLRLPTSSDDVVINMSGITVMHSTSNDTINSLSSQDALVISGGVLSIASASSIIRSLTISGGTLTGAGDLTVAGLTTWTGGTMSGTGTTNANGGLAIGAAGAFDQEFLDQRTLKNAGAATLAGFNSGYGLFLSSGATLENQAGASFALTSDTSINSFGGTPVGGTFVNAGTLSKTGGSGTSVVGNGITLIDTGTIQAFAGTLSLQGGGTISGAATLTAATIAMLDFGRGTFTAAAGTSVAATGVVSFSGGTVIESGIYNVAGTTLVNGGEVDFNSTASTAALNQPSGTIGGSGTLTVSGQMTWSGGVMKGGGTTRIAATGTLEVAGSVGVALDARTLDNLGSMVFSGAGWYFANGAVLNNEAGATFDIRSDVSIRDLTREGGGGAASTIDNAGTLEKTAGAGLTTIWPIVNNSGTVQAGSGTLSLSGGGTSSGNFSAADGATLSFGSGTQTLGAAAQVSGAGTIGFSGGITTLAGSFAVTGTTLINGGTANFETSGANTAALTVTAGTLGGAGTLTVVGAGTWSGGVMTGSGTTRIAATGTLAVGGPIDVALDTRTLDNFGSMVFSGAGWYFANGAVLNNEAGATFDIRSDVSIRDLTREGGSGAPSTIDNAGTLQKTAGAGLTTVWPIVNNSGAVQAGSGTLSLNGGGTSSGSFSASDGATLSFGSGTQTLAAAAQVSGAGTIGFSDGITTLAGSYAVTGTTLINGGTAKFDTSDATTAALTVTAGTLAGAGTLTVGGAGTWSGGVMKGGGTTRIAATGTLEVAGSVGVALDARTLDNLGSMVFSGAGWYFANGAVLNNEAGATFDIRSDVSIRDLTREGGSGAPSTIDNAGTLQKTAGAGLTTVWPIVNNMGSVILNSGNLSVASGSLSFDGSQILVSSPESTVTLAADLLGSTKNADLFKPQGVVLFNASSQKLEVMGQDLGSDAKGFTNNFAYGTLQLGASTALQLVDLSRNTSSASPEALYVDSLLVPAGSTLDLNGLKLYARTAVINGTVTGGSISQLAAGGPLGFSTPTSATITSSKPSDDWTFFGRANQTVTVSVHTGSQSSFPQPLSPELNFAQLQILDANGNVLAAASNIQSGTDATLLGVPLPADGTYHVHVQAAALESSSSGNYSIALWDATVRSNALNLNQTVNGRLYTGYEVHNWTFSAQANQQVQFDLLNSSNPAVEFDLIGPGGFRAFTNATASSGLINLPTSGDYALAVHSINGQTGSYAFDLNLTSQIAFLTNVHGTVVGNGQAQLFSIDVPANQQLKVELQDSSPGDRNELYLTIGKPPTRSDYQFRSDNFAEADQEVIVPAAAAGTWYILVYSAKVAAPPGNFTLTATFAPVLLTQVSPIHFGTSGNLILTLRGAGFDDTTAVSLMAADGTIYASNTVRLDSPTQVTGAFTAGTVPAGVYSVEVTQDQNLSAELRDSFTMIEGGQAVLETHITVPGAVGGHQPAVIYVEYSNTGDVAMSAPVLGLTATRLGLQGALLTLDPSLANQGYISFDTPPGYSQSVQILASGATPGLLQPGESETVPVYWAGWLRGQLLDFQLPLISFSLTSFTADDSAPIDWDSLQDSLRPTTISPASWNVIYPNLAAQIGDRWGGYVRSLDNTAFFLGRGGQSVYDVSKLWQFEVQQANGGAEPIPLALTYDLSATPGMESSPTIARAFPTTISGRNQVGPFGAGWQWENGWGMTLATLPGGSMAIAGADGSEFRYTKQGYGSNYIALAGDGSALTANSDGSFRWRESDGRVIVFAADGSESTIDDGAGETITAGYTAGLLTSLTASSGASLHMTYNGAGRIVTVTSSTGETASYFYDASNIYLTSVTGPGGTLSYTYAPATGSLTDNALLSVHYPDGKQDLYGYDSLGELGSFLSGYTVTGQVSDGSGNPIAAATVTLYSEANPQAQFITTTGPDGSYQIQGVAVGTYDVVVLINGFQTGITTGVTVAGPTSIGPSILAASSTTLSGTVVDPTGQAITAATVKVVDSAGRTIGTAVSAALGTFVITTASGNNLILQIFVPGSNAPKQQTISIPEGTTLNLGPVDPSGPGWLQQLLNGEHPRDFASEVQNPLPPLTSACCADALAKVENAIEVEDDGWDTYDQDYQSLVQQAEVDALVVAARVAVAAGNAAQLYLGLSDAGGAAATVIGLVSTIVSDVQATDDAPTLAGAIDILNNMLGTITQLVGDLNGLGTLSGFVGLAQAIYDAGSAVASSLSQLNTAALTANHDYERYQTYVARAFAARAAYNGCQAYAMSNGGQCKSPPPPPPPPPPGPLAPPGGGSPGGNGSGQSVGSYDPNSLDGPAGFGASHFVADSTLLSYRIGFENAAKATAPAQRVSITNQLPPELDWRTFELTGMGFGNTNVTIPARSQFYETTVSTTENGQTFNVEISASLNPTTGLLTVTFQSINPNTGLPPANPLTGFLPPDDGTGVGDGYISYYLNPGSDLPSGTEIRNVALITFDANAAIATDQVDEHDPSKGSDSAKQALVTIDSVAPNSSVIALPLTTNTASFTVSWSGTDGAGSGIASNTVFVSTDGGPFTAFQTATTASSATFMGAFGHHYGFFSVATDNVGNVEATPRAAQATTVTAQPSTGLSAVGGNGVYAGSARLTAILTVGGMPLAGKTVAFALSNGATLRSVGSATTDANGIATLPNVDLAGFHAGTAFGAVRASFAGDSTDAPSSATGNLVINLAMATVIWANPTDIVAGTPLGAAQLDAAASVPGTFTYTPAAGTVLNAGPGQALTVTFTPNDTVDYRVAVARVLINVAPRLVPPVTVLGVHWQTRKLSRKKTVKELVLNFSGALDPGHAQDLRDYHLVAAGRDKRFGSRDDKRVALASATYDPVSHTVRLAARGKVPNQKLQLSITAAGTFDSQHRPIDGDRDGQPGGDFRAAFGVGGIRLAGVPQFGTSNKVSAEAFDALLVARDAASTRSYDLPRNSGHGRRREMFKGPATFGPSDTKS
jgi:YD repeat-containing protein